LPKQPYIGAPELSIYKTPFPHLLPEDRPVWERFLAIYSSHFFRFEYDVRVGQGNMPDLDLPENILKMSLDLTQRRIDAVGFTVAGIVIIEITRAAGLKAIGQLKTYPILYKSTYDPPQSIKPLLVCEELRPDILPILIAENIDYVILPP